MTVYYPGAGSVDAILLGVAGNVIRLAVDGCEDAAEFRLVNGQWLSDYNEPVEIDSQPEPWWTLSSTGTPSPLLRVRPMSTTSIWVN